MLAGNQALNSTGHSNDNVSELQKMKSMKTNGGIVEEYTGNAMPHKNMSKIQSVQNFSKDSEL